MLRNSLSLNRLANVFHVILKEMKKYSTMKYSLKKKRIEHLKNVIRIIDVAIGILDNKVRLKGINKDFIDEARLIKNKQLEEPAEIYKDWLE